MLKMRYDHEYSTKSLIYPSLRKDLPIQKMRRYKENTNMAHAACNSFVGELKFNQKKQGKSKEVIFTESKVS